MDKNNFENILSLTPSQRGIYYESIIGSTPDLYVDLFDFKICDNIDIALFKRCWGWVVKNNEMLRANIKKDRHGQPLLVILKENRDFIQIFDLSSRIAGDASVLQDNYCRAGVQAATTMDKLFQVHLYIQGDDRHLMRVIYHHLICDGWSNGIVLREFFQYYQESLTSKMKSILPSKPKYSDYVKWILEQDNKESQRFWQERLADFNEISPLTNLNPHSKVGIAEKKTHCAKRYSFIIDGQRTGAINLLSKKNRTTPSTFFQAVWAVLLSKYLNKEDILFGLVISVRPPEIRNIEHLVGLCINTIPVRVQVRKKVRFITLIEEADEFMSLSARHLQVSLPDIMAVSGTSHHLFDHILAFENYPLSDLLKIFTENYENKWHFENHTSRNNYDFVVNVIPGLELTVIFRYNEGLFEEWFVEEISQHLSRVIDEVVRDPGIPVEKIEIIAEKERRKLVGEFNDTAGEYLLDKTVHQWFEEQVERIPDQVGVVGRNSGSDRRNLEQRGTPPTELNRIYRNNSITYNELNEKADQLAEILKRKGVLAEHIIGILMECSIDVIIGILGILKAGGAYLPIDSETPEERIRYMLSDSGVRLVVTVEGLADKVRIADCQWLRDDGYPYQREDPMVNLYQGHAFSVAACHLHPVTSLVYVIYTSGTTGKPKGVMLSHKNLVNYVDWFSQKVCLTEKDRTMLTSSFAFDLGYTSIFPCLLQGGQLHLLPKDIYLLAGAMIKYIKEKEITYIKVTPSLLTVILNHTFFSREMVATLRLVVVGGEPINVADIKKIHETRPSVEVMNHYGPTEATIGSVAGLIDFQRFAQYQEHPTIGRPIKNATIYILGMHCRLLPIGVPGELYISGIGIARGYMNNLDLTYEKFVHDLWDYRHYQDYQEENQNLLRGSQAHGRGTKPPGCRRQKIYKTGDLGRWLLDGNIEFLGRIDNQVKIRGYRIELGEIENRLLQHSDIMEAVVKVIEDQDNEKYLCGYYVSIKELPATDLKMHLSQKLPDYMLPSYFVFMDEFPLNQNGKVDRKMLPPPNRSLTLDAVYTPAGNEIEVRLLEIWRELLGIDTIGVTHNFFDVGGHSLKAMNLISKIYEQFNVQLGLRSIWEYPTIRQLAEEIRLSEMHSYAGIENVEQKEYYELSPAQKRLYVLHWFAPTAINYNMPQMFVLEGALEITRMEGSFRQLINRHESLRTSFLVVNGEPVQRVQEVGVFGIERYEGAEDEVPGLIRRFVRPFDLLAAPLLHIGLVRFTTTKYLFMFDMHHIISDGMSINIMLRDFTLLYQGEEMAPIKVQYKDFSQWRKKFSLSKEIQYQKKYWLNRFAGELPVLNLLTGYSRPLDLSFEGAHFSFGLEQMTVTNLYKLASTYRATLYMLILAACYVLLHRYTGQEDIIIGTPVAGRPHADLDNSLGMFVNTLAIRNYPEGKKSFLEFLKEVKQETLEAFENQDYPFDELIEGLNIVRHVNRNPLFDVMVAQRDINRLNFTMPRVSISAYEHSYAISKFDLTLFASQVGERLEFQWEYSTCLFKKRTIERLGGHLINIFNAIVQQPGILIKDVELMGAEEKEKLLYAFNNMGGEMPGQRTVQQGFAQRAADHLGKVALIYNDTFFTYRELKRSVNRVGRYLLESGVKNNETVGLYLDHTPRLVMAILGILQIGAAYLPMDTTFPVERSKYMMGNSGSRFVLMPGEEGPAFSPAVNRLYLDHIEPLAGDPVNNAVDLPVDGAAGDIAYQVYTSGSTGMPKGCLITQKGLVNYLEWAIGQYYSGEPVYFPLYSSIAFDLTVTSIFTPLLSGNTVVVYDQHLDVLSRICNDGRSNIIKLTPTHLRLLLDMDITHCALKKIIVGGEYLAIELAKKIYDKFQGGVDIYNEYGPTETVVGCMIHQFDPGKDQGSGVPIGGPIRNTRIYILDNHLKVCPLGAAGEIYIGGIGVSPGYCNRPELTHERFIPGFFFGSRESHLYKTGDLGICWEEGIIEFLGRKDTQVKIHGYRIELGEIEHKIMTYPGITGALVRVKEYKHDEYEEYGGHQERYLCAFLLSENSKGIIETDIRNFLARDLPEYMIPQFFIRLDSFPLLANGKVDEQSLPYPKKEREIPAGLPGNDIQEFLYSLWVQLLPPSNFGIHDNFFEIGGNSYLLLQMHQKINPKYPQVLVTDYFKYPSINALAHYISSLESKRISREKTIPLPGEPRPIPGDIAIIGIAFHLSSANTLEELYHLLKNKMDCISHLPEGRMKDVVNYLAYKGIEVGNYTFKEAAFLPSLCDFDYSFFNISKNEASVMDPHQRLFLQTAWHVFEDAGYPNDKLRGSNTGVFLGQPYPGDYYKRIKEIKPEMAIVAGPGNINAIIASRISYLLDLKGPNLVVDSACSSSLVALHLACQALRNGECDMALVGAINLLFEPVLHKGEKLHDIVSPGGRARTFSADADGTGQGEGVIGILLKPLDRALTGGDHIYGIVKGSAYNNDGNSIGITAPNGLRQEEVLCAAWENAGIDPATISYIEAHGTGTILGDPIEVDSLTRAFARYTDRKQFCGIGSIKTNYGHMDSAAGLLGVLKVIASFLYKQLLPNVHFNKPNSKIDFESSPVYVVGKVREWYATEGIRRAGVSAFGLSGTNCHVVLEAPPLAANTPSNHGSNGMKILPISAKNESALVRYVEEYIHFMEVNMVIDINELCYTAQWGRNHYPYRLAVMGRNRDELLSKLRKFKNNGFVSVPGSGIYYNAGVTPPTLRSTDGNGNDIVKVAVEYIGGESNHWQCLYKGIAPKKIGIPLYPFEKKRCWVEVPPLPSNIAGNNGPQNMARDSERGEDIKSTHVLTLPENCGSRENRKAFPLEPEPVLQALKEYIAELFEIKVEQVDADSGYFELGIDSVSIIQLEHYVKGSYGIDISANEMFNSINTPRLLAKHIAESGSILSSPWLPVQAVEGGGAAAVPSAGGAGGGSGVQGIQEEKQFLQSFMLKSNQELNAQQKEYLTVLGKRYEAKTKKSKAYIQSIRPLWANGRFIQGYNKAWKEFIYPVFAQKGQGAHIWDLDGNEYVDFAMGFGVNLLGYSHPGIKQAIQEQLEIGAVLGAMTTLPGEVAALIHDLTGVERVAFCNSGTEAIMNLVRIARGTAGKNKIALFAGSYHGTFDGVLVTKDAASESIDPIPRTLGTPHDMISNVIILEYGEEKSLEVIRNHAHELAAVLVEPVQSRNPLLQPKVFLQGLRRLTEELEIALIFDEIITGFRIHPGGAQAYFDVKADLVAYGKVLGGGMPIGIFAGKAKYMDRIDGGMWQYHDESAPNGFLVQTAGTFSHHPISMAAARATLQFLKAGGHALLNMLNEKTAWLAHHLNTFFTDANVPLLVAHFGSLFIFLVQQDPNLLRFLYYSLIEKGFYLWEGGTCFISSEHSEEDIVSFINAVQDTCMELVKQGCYPFSISPEALSSGFVRETSSNKDVFSKRGVVSNRNDLKDNGLNDDGLKDNSPEVDISLDYRKGLDLITHDADRHKAMQMIRDNQIIECIFPLSPMQEQVLAQNIHLYGTGNEVSFISYKIKGEVIVSEFHRACEIIFRRHSILRTAFIWRRLKEPLQAIYRNLDTPFVFIDWSDRPPNEQEANYLHFKENERKQGFKVTVPPLIKICLIKLEGSEWRLMIKHLNSLFDGWTSTMIFRELFDIYSHLGKEDIYPLKKNYPFINYISWLRTLEVQQAKLFWREAFHGFTPIENRNKNISSFQYEVSQPQEQSLHLTENEILSLHSFSKKYNLTLYTLFQAAWALELSERFKEECFLIGMALSGRSPALPGSDKMAGLFTNILPAVVMLKKEQTLLEWLKLLQTQNLRMRGFEYVTISQVAQYTQVPLTLLQEAVYNRTIVYLNFLQAHTGNQDFFQVTKEQDTDYVDVPLRLYVDPARNYEVKIRYDSHKYDDAVIKGIVSGVKGQLMKIINSGGRNAA